MKLFFIFLLFASLLFSQKNNNTLPVELIYFEAIPQVESILVKWGTATEIENYGFEVQRSTDLISFEVLEFIFGHGTTFSTHHYVYVDSPLISGTYYYRLKQIDTNGGFEITDTISATLITSSLIEDEISQIEFSLSQNFPNPFNPSTVISFQLSAASKVNLKVFDVLGNEIAVILNEEKNTGRYDVVFNSSNLTSGIYYYQLSAGNLVQTKKMILLK